MSSDCYFAKVESNIVTQVIVAPSSEWCVDCLGGQWEEIYMSGEPRRYAGIGWQFIPYASNGLGQFISPPPYPSWVINGNIEWEAPIPYPQDGNIHMWDEGNIRWE